MCPSTVESKQYMHVADSSGVPFYQMATRKRLKNLLTHLNFLFVYIGSHIVHCYVDKLSVLIVLSTQ